MVFVPKVGKRFDDLMHCDNYEPFKKNGMTNPNFNTASKILLNVKEDQAPSVDFYFKHLESLLEQGIVVVTVPGHDPASTVSGIKTISKKLSKNNRIDGSSCLVRTIKISKLSKGGDRSVEVHLNSITVKNPELFRGKDVLLLDDITTSGNSLKACKQLLLKAGAKRVQMLALGKTVQ